MIAWAKYNHFLGNVRVKACMGEKEDRVGFGGQFLQSDFWDNKGELGAKNCTSHVVYERNHARVEFDAKN